MNVLHIVSTLSGGAGAASFKIMQSLEKIEHTQHTIIYGHGSAPHKNAYKIAPSRKSPGAQISRLIYSLAKKGREQKFETFTPTKINRRSDGIEKQIHISDLIHLHWLGDWHFDLKKLLDQIPKSKPVVATMHDMNFITGGCHYPGGCRHYVESCQRCPQLPGLFGGYICKQSFKHKKRGYSSHKVALVPASKWLEDETRASFLGQCATRIQRIGYPFPDLKDPILPEIAEQRLQLQPTTKKRVLLVAQNLSNPRKGAALLLDALTQDLLPNCSILTIGDKLDVAHRDLQQLGFIREPELVRCAYACADVFCLPSLEENLAQTGIESLSEGTPVVCFNNTGPSDYVHDYSTGINCIERTPDSLAKAILECLKHTKLSNRPEVRDAYRLQHENKYAQNIVSKQYQDLYKFLLEAS